MVDINYEDMKNIVATQVCAQCGGELTIHSNVDTGKLEVWCPYHPDHHGYVERETYTQEFRRGKEVHPAIRDNIERKMILPGGQPVGVALAMIQTRFPRADMDEPSAALFLWDCVRLDLDPLLGEIFPVTFKVKAKDGTEKKVVQPLISEDGWLSLAARSCAEAWAGPPKTMRLEEYLQTQDAYREKPYAEVKEIAKEIKTDLCKDPEAYVWVAVGHRKDEDDTITYGWYKKSEEGIVAKNLPGNQARVRAIKRWVREVFPEAKAKMKEMTSTWMDRAGDVRDIQNVIEAEYHIMVEAPPETETELSPLYIAGLVDGDGSIRIMKSIREQGTPEYQLRVSVGNTNKAILDDLQAKLGGNVVHTTDRPGRKPFYEWGVHSSKAASLLEKLIPYLKIKKSQAKLGLEFQNAIIMHPAGRYHRVPDEEVAQRENYFLAMKKLNHLGERVGDIVTEAEPPTKQPKARAQATKTETTPANEKPPEEAIEGEGFTIDLPWLKESQKTLKWTDDTMLTFIISQYKVSGTSVTGALNKLTREQAEDFTRQINKRLEKQTGLF